MQSRRYLLALLGRAGLAMIQLETCAYLLEGGAGGCCCLGLASALRCVAFCMVAEISSKKVIYALTKVTLCFDAL